MCKDLSRKPSAIAYAILLLLGATIVAQVLLNQMVQVTMAQGVDIVIDGEDYNSTIVTETSSELIGIAQNVTPRLITEYADFGHSLDLQESSALDQEAEVVKPRIIIEYADFALFDDLWPRYMGPQPVSDSTPPSIGEPYQDPPSNSVLEYGQVRVSVNVTDAESGVENVILSYTVNDGSSWNPLTMTYNFSSSLYETTIPGKPYGTLVKYSITASDFGGNDATNDNAGEYFVYDVIPEFPSFLLTSIVMLAILLAALVRRRKLQKLEIEHNTISEGIC